MPRRAEGARESHKLSNMLLVLRDRKFQGLKETASSDVIYFQL